MQLTPHPCRLPHSALPQPIAASGIMSDRSRGQPSKGGMSHLRISVSRYNITRNLPYGT
ncbi:hypothetical protein GHK59_29735 [Sinorhizobium meliloti]|nr:hypothetical protein [Sinorhizobium meliloti]